ncbi:MULTISPECIES: YkgJ family cysteine cluster protein [unclassified Luteimonas]
MPDSPHCSACDAVCCRLTVVLQPGDSVPAHLTTQADDGLQVMARDEEGWCVAIDPARMQCRIYDTRPENCRRFAMAGNDCRQVRADYTRQGEQGIPLVMY